MRGPLCQLALNIRILKMLHHSLVTYCKLGNFCWKNFCVENFRRVGNPKISRFTVILPYQLAQARPHNALHFLVKDIEQVFFLHWDVVWYSRADQWFHFFSLTQSCGVPWASPKTQCNRCFMTGHHASVSTGSCCGSTCAINTLIPMPTLTAFPCLP